MLQLPTREDETKKCGHEMEQGQPQRHPNPGDSDQMRDLEDHENDQEDVAEEREERPRPTRHATSVSRWRTAAFDSRAASCNRLSRNCVSDATSERRV